MKDIIQYINESMHNITKLVDKAIEQMTNIVLDNIDYDFLSNADDIDKCDVDDIANIIDLAVNNRYLLNELNSEKFSINDITKKYRHINTVSVIDDYVEDNWQDDLDEDLVDALNDFFKVGGIINKTMLNGGRFEAFRDFQIAVENNVINKIRKIINNEK